MTNRESEQRIVPLTPGNVGRGKALSPTRDASDTPAVRSDGQESLVNPAVHDRLLTSTKELKPNPRPTSATCFTC